jgi:hypothetical protein
MAKTGLNGLLWLNAIKTLLVCHQLPGKSGPNVVKYVIVDSEKGHIQHDPNEFFVDLWFNDKGTGETFLACCHVTGEDETHTLEKTASLMELVTGGEGEYLFRLTLKPLCEYCQVLLGIELLEGQEA